MLLALRSLQQKIAHLTREREELITSAENNDASLREMAAEQQEQERARHREEERQNREAAQKEIDALRHRLRMVESERDGGERMLLVACGYHNRSCAC